MSDASRTATTAVGYGSRPVSVDLARGQRLAESRSVGDDATMSTPVGSQPDRTRAADRLALAHWPAGHQVVIGSVAGGVGRTTVAGLIALTLAGLPYAHVHRAVALRASQPEPLSTASRRWGAAGDNQISVRRNSQVSVLAEMTSAEGDPVVIVDLPGGLTSLQHCFPRVSRDVLVLVTRPDATSIAGTARALVWLYDSRVIDRRHVCVVVNDGVGDTDHGARAASTALSLRAGAVHRLPAHPALGPGQVLPHGRRVPRSVAKAMTLLCLSVHTLTRVTATHTEPLEENTHA